MSFIQFPDQQYFRVLDTGVETRLGYFNLAAALNLREIMLTIYVQGLIPAPFQAQLKVYGNDRMEVPIFSSQLATLSQATLGQTGNWTGNIYIDFDGYPINPDIDYYVTISAPGYTRNADAFYLGIGLDWYSPVNNQLTAGQAGARMRILGDK